jgi:hypothetical protein
LFLFLFSFGLATSIEKVYSSAVNRHVHPLIVVSWISEICLSTEQLIKFKIMWRLLRERWLTRFYPFLADWQVSKTYLINTVEKSKQTFYIWTFNIIMFGGKRSNTSNVKTWK